MGKHGCLASTRASLSPAWCLLWGQNGVYGPQAKASRAPPTPWARREDIWLRWNARGGGQCVLLVSERVMGPPLACPSHGQPKPWQRGLIQSLPLSAAPKGSARAGPKASRGLSLSSLLPTAFATTGASSANRFVSIGPRDGNFLNIPQQSQVGGSTREVDVGTGGRGRGGGITGREGRRWLLEANPGEGARAGLEGPGFCKPS